jgi:membrane protein required for colicin V production
MNTFDVAVIVIVSFCLIRGVFKGLIGEMSGIIGVIAGFYGAYTYYPTVAVYGKQWISSEAILNLLAFFVLFVCILTVISLVSVLIRKLLKLAFLGWVDRGFGLVFGAAKGILIMTVVLVILTTFIPKNSVFLKDSYFSPYLAQVSKALTVFVSQNARNDYLKNLEGLFKF